MILPGNALCFEKKKTYLSIKSKENSPTAKYLVSHVDIFIFRGLESVKKVKVLFNTKQFIEEESI